MHYYVIILHNFRAKLVNHEICQISVELHGFGERYHTVESEFKPKFIDFLKTGDFLPLIHGGEAPGFNRMFWLNFQSPVCIERYLLNYCD